MKMTNELMQIGSRDILGKTVTAFGTVDNPLFLAKDVAEWIGVQNVSQMLEPIDGDEKTKVLLPSIQCIEGLQANTEYWFLTENGLYEVLFLSRKPVAKEFKSGVKQLLHDLRTGKKQLSGIELIAAGYSEAMKQIEHQEKIIELQTLKISEDKPKVLFSEAVATSNTDILVGELAKILKQNGVDIGQNRLFEKLRDEGYLCKTGSQCNMPTQRSMEMGLFRIKETSITHSDGHITISKTAKVTGRGQIYFINKFLGEERAIA
jgi:phage antirepressor YoqD-like protein